jgi:peptidoglycan/LPS O-acetylase OafA/YrhL
VLAVALNAAVAAATAIIQAVGVGFYHWDPRTWLYLLIPGALGAAGYLDDTVHGTFTSAAAAIAGVIGLCAAEACLLGFAAHAPFPIAWTAVGCLAFVTATGFIENPKGKSGTRENKTASTSSQAPDRLL